MAFVEEYDFLIEKAESLGISIPPLHLIDVGVSGGIHERWNLWNNKLQVDGFDILSSEIQRLKSTSTKNLRYHNFLSEDRRPALKRPIQYIQSPIIK